MSEFGSSEPGHIKGGVFSNLALYFYVPGSIFSLAALRSIDVTSAHRLGTNSRLGTLGLCLGIDVVVNLDFLVDDNPITRSLAHTLSKQC